ncbi:MAG TPA: ABC transporter ATP-binding protein [Actinobacteria bacterium]|nr:ABC transporter ATP-binding protein [Actinomycetota bacterium]
MLEVDAVTVRFGAATALDGFSLRVPQGRRVAVMGPSGSGKSTLLRVVAGLQRPDGGHVRWAGVDVTDVPPHRRGFGLMFQDYALFPHRSVAGNVAYGLEMAGRSRAEIAERVRTMLELVGLPGAEDRDVATLSGGEQQRVALARTLAPAPRLVLLDEPLGSLDRALRDRLLVDMPRIFDRIGATVVYVTHDREEAFAVGDEIVVARAGRDVATGTPEALWHRPPDAWVARFIGLENVFPITRRGEETTTGWWTVPRVEGTPDATHVVIPPEAVRLGTGPLAGTVADARFLGGHYLVRLRLDVGVEIVADVPTVPARGSRVAFDIDPGRVVLVPDQPTSSSV